MRLAAGLLVPDAGTITVLGMDATVQSLQVQGAIGYMPQRFGLYEDLTVQENLDLYADLQDVHPWTSHYAYARHHATISWPMHCDGSSVLQRGLGS
jgi:ABC-2 type transport system ATP-binding protein